MLELLLDEFELELLELLLDELELELLELLLDELEFELLDELELLFELVLMRGRPSLNRLAGWQAAVVPMIAAAASVAEAIRRRAR